MDAKVAALEEQVAALTLALKGLSKKNTAEEITDKVIEVRGCATENNYKFTHVMELT